MNIVKQIAREQYKNFVNKIAKQVHGIRCPTEGWICTVRNAIGMSAAQLARRLRVSRYYVSKTEKAELSGAVTIKTMQNMAEGMGCRFVYAIVPERTVGEILANRAMNKALQMVDTTNKHMALESQALSETQIAIEIRRVQKMLLDEMPPDFWNDEI